MYLLLLDSMLWDLSWWHNQPTQMIKYLSWVSSKIITLFLQDLRYLSWSSDFDFPLILIFIQPDRYKHFSPPKFSQKPISLSIG